MPDPPPQLDTITGITPDMGDIALLEKPRRSARLCAVRPAVPCEPIAGSRMPVSARYQAGWRAICAGVGWPLDSSSASCQPSSYALRSISTATAMSSAHFLDVAATSVRPSGCSLRTGGAGPAAPAEPGMRGRQRPECLPRRCLPTRWPWLPSVPAVHHLRGRSRPDEAWPPRRRGW